MKHTILVVDDHPLFRKGVIQLLGMEPSFEVVGEAGHFDEDGRLPQWRFPALHAKRDSVGAKGARQSSGAEAR